MRTDTTDLQVSLYNNILEDIIKSVNSHTHYVTPDPIRNIRDHFGGS